MMTPTRLAAAGEPVASEGVDFSASLPATPQEHTHDFSRLMSQAAHQRAKHHTAHEQNKTTAPASPAQNAPAKTSRAQTASTARQSQTNTIVPHDESPDAETNADASFAAAAAMLEATPDSDAADAADSTSDADESAKTDANLDPILASTLMAMLTQTAIKPNELRSWSLKPGTNLKTGAGGDPALAAVGIDDGEASGLTTATDSPATGSVGDKKADSNQGSMKIPKGMKPVLDNAHLPPADILAQAKLETAKTTDPNTPSPQAVASKVTDTATDSLLSTAPPDGTAAALNRQRMKFVAEKNETAGRTVQKLPSASSTSGVVTTSAAKPVAAADSDASAKKDGFESTLNFDWAGKPAVFSMEQGNVSTTTATDTAAQVERVSRLVNQEVVMIRQSGANNLAVSLKVDAHTELFLQLTHHDGQIQASLRVERGSGAGLDQHWNDLQESLAKQNVQLLPLENKAVVRNTFSPLPETAGNSSFQQPSQNSQRQAREVAQDFTTAAPVKTISTKTTKTKTISRQGWESWA